jgi:ABC-type multidrug transport system ATPase subunit
MFRRRTPGSTSAKDALPALDIHLLCHEEIEPFSLTIKQGEIFGLVGPAGSGASTIIDLLRGRKTPLDGVISIMGYDVRRFEQRARQLVGVVPQVDLNTLGESGTPKEHLQFHARLIGMSERLVRQRIPHVLQVVGLARYEHLQVSAFSYAFKQRLALARALLADPALLLLDEPTRDIPAHDRAAFWKLLLVLRAQGKTILLATPDWEEASALCDRVAHLSRGHLQAIWQRAAKPDRASATSCSRAVEPT